MRKVDINRIVSSLNKKNIVLEAEYNVLGTLITRKLSGVAYYLPFGLDGKTPCVKIGLGEGLDNIVSLQCIKSIQRDGKVVFQKEKSGSEKE